LLLGGSGKEVIDALGIQEPFQNGSAITQMGRSLTKGAKMVSNSMTVTSMRDMSDPSNEVTM
jgi:hypothetical protein